MLYEGSEIFQPPLAMRHLAPETAKGPARTATGLALNEKRKYCTADSGAAGTYFANLD